MGATLNWRRDPDYEQRLMQYEQRKMQHEVRMKQLENEILRVRNDSEQIKKETGQLKLEKSMLAKLNAREKVLSALIKQRCFPPESSSTPPQQTESDCGPSLP